ncbi:hypothetical protein [Pistricoccus aurantiacus]|uniref:hypothetical protein n=1 Tax=Pistricoccus aurantiacus TaxID=1883414 RepID=UPI001C953002
MQERYARGEIDRREYEERKAEARIQQFSKPWQAIKEIDQLYDASRLSIEGIEKILTRHSIGD